MDFVNLKYFIETYENKSITVASASLHISEQGLSKAIRALEREWEFPLFVRRKNRLSPTAFGDAFYVQARHLMNEYEKSCRILENVKAENSVLHIGFGSCVLPAHWLPLFSGEEDMVSLEVSDIKKRKIYMVAEKARSQNPLIADFSRFIKSLDVETIG